MTCAGHQLSRHILASLTFQGSVEAGNRTFRRAKYHDFNVR
jgi:hypothetical protein